MQVEGAAVAERTMTVREQPMADLVGRQLSDRERDPVFNESMAVAKVLAQSLLGYRPRLKGGLDGRDRVFKREEGKPTKRIV